MAICWQARYELGVEAMDSTHREFIELLAKADSISKEAFAEFFETLLEHTKSHFESEKELMKQSRFPSEREHQDDHDRILAEMMQMQRFASRGMTKIAKEYVTGKLPDWFDVHAASMDTALALHLKQA